VTPASANQQEERTGQVRDWAILVRLLGLLLPYWPRVTGSVLCAVGDMALQVLGPLVISVAIDRYLLRHAGSAAIAWLPQESGRGLAALSVDYLVILILTLLMQALGNYWANWTGEKAMADLRARLFAHLQKLDLAFFDSNPTGRLVTRITTDVEALSEMFSDGIVGIAANLLMVVLFLAAMLNINPGLTVILAVVLPMFALMTVVFRRAVTPTQQRVRIYIARINAMLAEHINGVSVLQLFNRQERSHREFDAINRQHMLASVGWITANAWFLPAVELMGTIAQGGLILVGATLLAGGKLTVGILVAFLQYGAKFLKPIQDVSERYGILQTSIVSADRIFKLLDTPAPVRPASEGDAPNGIDIEFDHVMVRIPG
jgi:ATP-binding cassette subfamily B protein